MNQPRFSGVLLLLLLIAVLALTLRWPHLDARPMHNDEGVNALKFGDLWAHGSYKYDPQEHHGPTLPYATAALGYVTRAPDLNHFSDTRLRSLTVLFGVGILLLLPLFIDGLGRSATLWAALFMAVSTSMVFYSRYYIHEILLVFLSLATFGTAWRYWRTRRLLWAVLAGTSLGLMQATKETFILSLGAAVLALALNLLWNRVLDASGPPLRRPHLKPWHLATAIALWLLAASLLLSSLLTNPVGILDSLRTYQPWLARASGASVHIHPWYFYLQRLLIFQSTSGPFWTEGFILLLALAGGAAGFKHRLLPEASAGLVRFLTFYTLVLTSFYSLIPYKTPWCLLNFWMPAILLAGVGAAVLARSVAQRPLKVGVGLLFLAGAAHLAWQARLASVEYAADRRNPYVYAQTSPDVLNLISQLRALAEVWPQGRQLSVSVAAPEDDYGPLPWYLRDFPRVAWGNRIPDAPSPVMLISSDFRADLEQSRGFLMVGYFKLRPDKLFELYVEPGLWAVYLRARQPQGAGP